MARFLNDAEQRVRFYVHDILPSVLQNARQLHYLHPVYLIYEQHQEIQLKQHQRYQRFDQYLLHNVFGLYWVDYQLLQCYDRRKISSKSDSNASIQENNGYFARRNFSD